MQVHQPPPLLLTRPRAASERFAQGLGNMPIVIAPLMEIVGTGAEVSLNGIAGVILTSENALSFTPKASLPAYCVGPRTAEVARKAGFDAQIMGPDADGLVKALIQAAPKGPLLHLHGTHTRGDVAARLTEAGVTVTAIAVYDQQDIAPDAAFFDALEQPNLAVPLFSPRSAVLFAKATPSLRQDARLFALSPAVARALPQNMRAQCEVITAPNGAEMRAALRRFGAHPNSP